jgi:hypothetical protein
MTPYSDGECPCTSSCGLHGDCQACQAAHRSSGSETSCEKLGVPRAEEEPRYAVNLLDFTPCAG